MSASITSVDVESIGEAPIGNIYPPTLARRSLPGPARRRASLGVGALVVIVLLAGCGETGVGTRAGGSVHMVGMAGMKGGSAHMASTAGDSGRMVGMNMSGGSARAGAGSSSTGVTANGIKPVPIQILGTADWQGMKITAQVMTPVPFVVYNGTSQQLVKPGKASFHLMVMLNDADTGVPIPYATVWATITKNGKVLFDERQWPMISRYMGPHYGNDVALPGAGTYKLSLLISPPVSARHIEYANVWLKPHQVSFTFPWKPI
jgi:uncharacterized protein involved in high-affinity Fe2+ transport